jgi:hypothetical protein
MMVSAEVPVEKSRVFTSDGKTVARVEKYIEIDGEERVVVRIIPNDNGSRYVMHTNYPDQKATMKRGSIQELLKPFNPLAQAELMALLGLADPIDGMEFELKCM